MTKREKAEVVLSTSHIRPDGSGSGRTPAGERPQALLDTQEAADYLRLSRNTLAKWRCSGGGPEFILAGRKVLYAAVALDRWLSARRRCSTSDVGK